MKILHLEDNPLDAALTHPQFQEEWPDCEIDLVDNRAAFTEKLSDGKFDLILSDFNLVGFNGLEALKLAHDRIPDTPFIFFSGTIGEERAVEALRSGATDYVIKDRPKRLITAVRRAIHDAQLAKERRAAEEQMLRVQRLENVGMLAAGIAHDINNVLSPIIMGVTLLQGRHTGDLDRKILSSMESSAARGAGMVKQILGFAHGVTGEAQLIDPRHLIRDLVGIMHQTFPKNIQIKDETPRDLWPIKANPTQFHQVLLNLCVNARDAMPAGGTLTLQAMNRDLDAVSAAGVTGIKAGSYLWMEISDTGTGIPAAILQKIWEPFFTTKAPGRGTGLGLGTVRGIVHEHGGAIILKTEVGRGTSFELLLPASPSKHSTADGAPIVDIPRGEGELILVAEDDASVREVTCATLTAHGYRVLAAADGTEAVGLFAMHSSEFRALVTDIDMPNLDGVALTKIASTLNRSVRTLLVSGSAEVNDTRRAPPPNGLFLAKPFSTGELLKAVHELLHTGQEAAP